MWPFKKKQTQVETGPPPEINELHHFQAPSKNTRSPNATWGWAAREGVEVPPIPDQDKILIHWFRPPAAENPVHWYHDRNQGNDVRNSEEHLNAEPHPINEARREIGPDPRWTPPVHTRATQLQSPSSYSFTRPFDQRTRHRLTGVASSMTSNQRSFSVGGMNPIKGWRNTYRRIPANRDAIAADYAFEQNPVAEVPQYFSPNAGLPDRAYRITRNG